MTAKPVKTRNKATGTDTVLDSRRLQYMSRYGLLKDELLPLTGRNPEFTRSNSEPAGAQNHIPPPIGFINSPAPNYSTRALHLKRDPKSLKSICSFSVEDQLGDCRQPLLLHSTRSKRSTDSNDFFPYFSYLITVTHIVIFIVHWIIYGFAPTGIDIADSSHSLITLPNGTVKEMCWTEPGNVLLGPREADLIQAGALYPPCMRVDPMIHTAVVERQRQMDRMSGCCIFYSENRTRCYQTSRSSQCQGSTQSWLRYAKVTANSTQSPKGINDEWSSQLPGPVCGLDPNYCLVPRSTDSMPWSKDITKWPICEHSTNISDPPLHSPHMQCEPTARPCCFGIRGDCVMTTREHCSFIRGTYHPEAALCSQVNCLKAVCGLGMFFISGDYPDQFYRLFTSLFVHSGLIPLVITVCLQLTFVYNLERFVGFWVTVLVYFVSGIFGNLLAGYFLPYHVGSGPVPALMGLSGFRAVNYFFYSGPDTYRGCSSTNFLASKSDSTPKPNSTSPGHSIRLSTKREKLRQIFHNVKTYLHRRRKMKRGVYKNVFLNLAVFVCGTLPWIDNFALLGGFLSGIVVTFIVLPYKALCIRTCNQYTSSRSDVSTTPLFATRQRVPVEVLCSLLWLILFIGLFCLFTFGPTLHCDWCTWFTCIPLAPHLCDRFHPSVIQNRSSCVPEEL